MPIPVPSKDETKDKFISRCMGNEAMLNEYPDNKQRAAICYGSWKNKRKEANMEIEFKNEIYDRFGNEITEAKLIDDLDKIDEDKFKEKYGISKSSAQKKYKKILEAVADIETKELAKLYNIEDVEIFATGDWNGDKYTEEDLNNIVKAFEETKDELKPPVKLGHDKEQKLLQSDGLPAAGWVKNLRKVGNKLVADLIDIPKKIYELIKNKAYKRVSSELYIKYKGLTGKVYPLAFKALALLGGDTPAVGSLKDMEALYSENGNQYKIIDYSLDNNINKEEGKMADIEKKEESPEVKNKEEEKKEVELKKEKQPEVKVVSEMDEIKKVINDPEKLVQFIKNTKLEKEAAEKKMAEAKEYMEKMRKEEIKKYINTQLVEGKISPKQSENLEIILNNIKDEEIEFIRKEENIEIKGKKKLVETLKEFIESYPKLDFLKEFSNNEFKGNGEDQIEARIKAYCKENNLDYNSSKGYSLALNHLKEKQPELFNG